MQHSNPYAAKTYQQINVQSLSPGEQVARLLETAARHIARARAHAEAKEFEQRFYATEDAMKIVTGLQGCLSADPQASAMRTTLENYYAGVILLISRINVRNDLSACDAAMESLRTMAGTWREAEKIALSNHEAAASLQRLDATVC
jgi:flagellar biosynthetic protein FliS